MSVRSRHNPLAKTTILAEQIAKVSFSNVFAIFIYQYTKSGSNQRVNIFVEYPSKTNIKVEKMSLEIYLSVHCGWIIIILIFSVPMHTRILGFLLSIKYLYGNISDH